MNMNDEIAKLAKANKSVEAIEVECDYNELNPLDLITLYDTTPTTKSNYHMTVLLTEGKTVTFKKGGVSIFTVKGGPDMDKAFKDVLYLLPLLMRTCFVYVAKKLAPPVSVSETQSGAPA